MNPRFNIFEDSKGQWRFNLQAPNGEIILASEGYTSKQACKKGIEAIQRYANIADVPGKAAFPEVAPSNISESVQPKVIEKESDNNAIIQHDGPKYL